MYFMKVRSTIIAVVSVLLLICSVASADSLVSLMGWPYDVDLAPGLNYSTNPPLGTDPIFPRITRLVYPVLGFPAIAEVGEDLQVIVKFPDGVVFLDPAEWQVRLTTRMENPYDAYAPVGDPVGQSYDMTIKDIQYEQATQTYQLTCEIPWGAPEDLFHLVVTTDQFIDFQPSCVNVKQQIGDNFSFVHITDAQAADPRSNTAGTQLNSGDYPDAWNMRRSDAILKNELQQELPLLRPDLVLFTGDETFGLHHAEELTAFYRVAQETQAPLFMVPGNHDGYAYFDWTPSVKDDGLELSDRILGPLYFSFDIGPLHFVGINSYDGTPIRRSAGNLVVASPVDNWGGFISEEQLNWVGSDLNAAKAAGMTSIMFLHHDPRGPYTADKPYPTNPFSGDGSEYWNYESSEWDSNPYDNIADETPESNTGTRLLRIALNSQVSHMFIGHNHYDAIWQYMPGDPIADRFDYPVGGLFANGPFTIIQTTSCASSNDIPTAYDGYRWVTVANGMVNRINYLEEPILEQSIPAGNLWREQYNNDGASPEATIVVFNGLPTAMGITLEFYLPANDTGYEVLNENQKRLLPFHDVGLGDGGQVIIYIKDQAEGTDVDLEDFPVSAGQEKQTSFITRVKTDNLPPAARLLAAPAETEGVWDFDASDSIDPEGGALRFYWDFGDGYRGTNEKTTHRYVGLPGNTTVVLTVMDQYGAVSTAQTILKLPAVSPDTEHDTDEHLCGECGIVLHGSDWFGALPMLALLLGLIGFQFAKREKK